LGAFLPGFDNEARAWESVPKHFRDVVGVKRRGDETREQSRERRVRQACARECIQRLRCNFIIEVCGFADGGMLSKEPAARAPMNPKNLVAISWSIRARERRGRRQSQSLNREHPEGAVLSPFVGAAFDWRDK
jgi:hypothetical protein